MATQGNPQWWGTQQTSTWDRVKEALSRDWEQTKADFSNEYGKDLNQNATDTVKQAIGKEPIPAPNQKNPLDDSLSPSRSSPPTSGTTPSPPFGTATAQPATTATTRIGTTTSSPSSRPNGTT